MSVLTPAIPSRLAMLAECRASVLAQITDAAYEHLIHLDEEYLGCGWTMNYLAAQAEGEWVLPLADDDLLLPNAIRLLLASSEEADIVYAPPLVSQNGDVHFWGQPPYIPSFALIKASLWRELGGYEEGVVREEDRGLWVKALAVGARFVRIEEPVWVYRFHRGNKSYHQGIAS